MKHHLNLNFIESSEMKSILDVPVSCFRNYNTPSDPVTISLKNWLLSDKYEETVQKIRETESKQERDKLKAVLPAITPSGVFTYRSEKNIIQHSGFLQFDIDFKENKHIINYDELKSQICNIPNVAYCGLSVSGTGYWGLVPIAYKEKHKQHFDYLLDAFKSLNIILDQAPKNIASLRGYSFDPEPYFNHAALPLFQFKEVNLRQNIEAQITHPQNLITAEVKVEACILEIEKQGIDLTSSYQKDWLPIGCNFASTFGEMGRFYFHKVSQFHPDYNQHKTDVQYDRCLRSCKGPGSLGVFFLRCASHGIFYKDLIKS